MASPPLMSPPTAAAAGLAARARELYAQTLRKGHERADHLFAGLMVLQWFVVLLVAIVRAPHATAVHGVDGIALVNEVLWIGGLLVGAAAVMAVMRPGSAPTRHTMAICQLLTSMFLVRLFAGHVEVYFHVFVSLAFLTLYRDAWVLGTACLTVGASRAMLSLFPYTPDIADPTMTLGSAADHLAWVVFGAAVLAASIVWRLRDMRLAATHMAELESSRADVERQVLERTHELAASETRFRMLASSAPIGIYASDAAGEIVFVNPRWSELSGLTTAETLGMGFVSAVHPDDLDGLKAAREATLERHEPFHHSFRLLRHDGEIVWVNVRAAPLCEPDGSITGYVGTVEDIGIFKRAEAELIRAREAALDAARLKSEFLANVSHEIRTPMNGIIGLTDLMLSAEHTDEQHEYLSAVRGSADALMRVVGDILDFSRIEAGTVHIRSVPFCLRDTLESVVQSLAMRAKEKGLALSYEIGPEVPNAVVGDPGRVRQVLLNLLGNAIKFTERGSVQASVRCVKNVLEGMEGAVSDSAPVSAGFVQLEFSVHDTGIGIPEDKQQLIFEAFRQGDGSTTRRHGGTGLGLAIGSQLAELMGGYIRVESELGAGSTFRFTVPFQLPEEAARPEPVAPVLLPEGPVRGSRTLQRLRVAPEQALRVLLAEDQSVNRILATRILEMLGHHVTAVEDGTQVMARLKSGERYDVLVLDISMPLLDGYETTSAIRAREAATPWVPRLPIIALTAHALPEDRDRCLAAGMDGYASKPFKAVEVMAAIDQARKACGLTATVAQSSTPGRRAA